MKQLITLLFLITVSASAFAQFPLGSTKGEIKTYFGENIQYSSLQNYKTENGTETLCFTKMRVVGDYTFYFDEYGKCVSYVVTYDLKDMPDVITRFDTEFCRMEEKQWESLDKLLVLPWPLKKPVLIISVSFTSQNQMAYWLQIHWLPIKAHVINLFLNKTPSTIYISGFIYVDLIIIAAFAL